LADTLPSDGDLSRAEVVDGVVDPFLAVDIDVEQLCARDLDRREAFGQFGTDERERSPWHVEPLQRIRVSCECDRHGQSSWRRPGADQGHRDFKSFRQDDPRACSFPSGPWSTSTRWKTSGSDAIGTIPTSRWTKVRTIGSTNLDSRSFALNEELSPVVYHTTVVAQLEQVFEEDLRYARKIEYQQWRGRGFFRQFLELLSLPIRQQL
jgi:hypothetical protein